MVEPLVQLQRLDVETIVEICGEVMNITGEQPFVDALHRRVRLSEASQSPSRGRIEGNDGGVGISLSGSKKLRKREGKPFEMSRWAKRDIALWLSYEGEGYSGLAEQRHVEGIKTVEKVLFEALVKCCLIESRDTCHYSRCGRTDRGVSAQCQVVGLRVRSVLRADDELAVDGVVPRLAHPGEELKPGIRELDYCDTLNRVLPPDVRAMAWRSVAPEFSARFSAASRTYRYFFYQAAPRTAASYNLDRMRQAAAKLVGEHDFRNLCKMDVEHVKNYRRVVYDARVDTSGVDDVFCFQITGQAFLWHMVRCCVAVLLLVAQGLEEPDVVDILLDVENETRRRPHYQPAPEVPLVLQECSFDSLAPASTPEALARLTQHHEHRLEEALILSAKRRNALDYILGLEVRRQDLDDYLGIERSSPTDSTLKWAEASIEVRTRLRSKFEASYRPLGCRLGAMTYEERIRALGGRKREKFEANDKKRQASAPTDQTFHAEMRRYG